MAPRDAANLEITVARGAFERVRLLANMTRAGVDAQVLRRETRFAADESLDEWIDADVPPLRGVRPFFSEDEDELQADDVALAVELHGRWYVIPVCIDD